MCRRRDAPQDDFTSIAGMLLANGGLPDDRTLGFWCMGFVIGGLETTRDALSIGFYELMKHRIRRNCCARIPRLLLPPQTKLFAGRRRRNANGGWLHAMSKLAAS